MSGTRETWTPPLRRGFTLVELLIVVGIISVLTGLLLPAMMRSRTQARSIACQSNLRQWAVAVIAYSQESNGLLPRRGQGVQKLFQIDRRPDWFNALPRMLRQASYVDRFNAGNVPQPADGSMWSCPEFAILIPHTHQLSYAMNMKLSTWNNLFPDKINRIGPTTAMVFMADAPGPYASILPSAVGEYNPVARHGGRANLAFLDGHVASYTSKEIGIGSGESERTDVVWKPKYSTWSPQ